MANILIALGSNYHQSANIQWASQRLVTLFTEVTLTPVFWTTDIHGQGLWYMNRLLHAKTTLSPTKLIEQLKQIEQESRRTKEHVTIDLDLMQYNQERYHHTDWERPYIQKFIKFL